MMYSVHVIHPDGPASFCRALYDRRFLKLQADLKTVISTWNQEPLPNYDGFELIYPGVLDLLRSAYPNGGPKSVREACSTLFDAVIARCRGVPKVVYRGLRHYRWVLSNFEASDPNQVR